MEIPTFLIRCYDIMKITLWKLETFWQIRTWYKSYFHGLVNYNYYFEIIPLKNHRISGKDDPFKYLIKQPLFQYLKNCRFYFTLKVYLIEPKTNLKKETSLSNEIRNRSNRFIRILRWNLWGQGSRIVRVARNPGGQPGGACRIFDLPSPPRYSSTVSGAARRRWWPINTDRSLTCTYVSVARVESREEQHRFFSFIFPPFFPPFFLSPLHPSSSFFFFLERSGRWSLPRADLDVSAIRFRSKRDRPTGNLRGWPMIGR